MTIGNNSVADNQSEASAGTHRFGREKRLEHVRLNFRGNAWPVVNDFDYNLIVFPAGSNTDFAGAIDRVDGIINEVGPHLIKFVAISQDARQ